MRKTVTFWVRLSLVTLLAALLSIGVGAQTITLQVATGDPGNPQFAYLYEEFDKAFMERHPNITIERIAGPFSVGMLGRTEWFTVRYAGGALPDVVDVNYLDSRTLASQGILMDLSPFFERDTSFDADDFFDILWEPFRYQGGRYAIPATGWPWVTVYNADALDRSGLAPPPRDWELDGEYREYLRRVTLDTNGDGEIDQFGQDRLGASEGAIGGMLRAFGESLFNADETRVTVNTPGAIEALQWWVELAETRRLTSPRVWSQIRSERGGLPWIAEATVFAGLIAPQVEQYQPEFTARATPPPIGPTGNRYGGVYGWGWGIPRTTEHPDAAWLYLSEWASSEHYQTLAREMGLTGRQSTITTVLEFYAERWPSLDVGVWSEAFAYVPYDGPLSPGASQMLGIIEDFGSLILNGGVSTNTLQDTGLTPLSEAADNLALRLQTILDAANAGAN